MQDNHSSIVKNSKFKSQRIDFKFSYNKERFELYYIAYFLFISFLSYFITLGFCETRLEESALVIIFNSIIRVSVVLFLLITILKIFLEWKNSFSVSQILACLVTAGLIIFSNFNFYDYYFITLAVAIIGAVNVDGKKLMRAYSVMIFALLIITIVLNILDVIPSHIVYRDADKKIKRYALGFVYATYFSAYFFSATAAYIYSLRRKIKLYESLIIVALSIVIFYFTNARISTACCLLLVLFANLFFDNKKKYVSFLSRNKICRFILLHWFSILAVISIIFSFLYTKSKIIVTLDKILSGRISSGSVALHRYGISFLGKYVNYRAIYKDNQIGLMKNFFIINSSFITVLILTGIIGLIGFVLAYTFAIKHELKNKSIINALCIFTFGIYFFFEPRIIRIALSPFIVIGFTKNGEEEKTKENIKGNAKENNVFNSSFLKKLLTIIVLALFLEVFVFNIKTVVSTIDSSRVIKEEDIGNMEITESTKYIDDVDNYEYSKACNDYNSKNKIEIYEDAESLYYFEDGIKEKKLIINYDNIDNLRGLYLGLTFYTAGDYYEYQSIDGIEYKAKIYLPEGNGFSFYKEYEICNDISKSCYLPINNNEFENNENNNEYDYDNEAKINNDEKKQIIVVLDLPDDLRFSLTKVYVNGVIPFDISIVRILLMILIFGGFNLIYCKLKKA